ncbi:MAG: GHKL domain-containing protein [Lachnospiraceae bacterium]|nr:GHKL domain-containing protein [Lachnospiraceae bacterium]
MSTDNINKQTDNNENVIANEKNENSNDKKINNFTYLLTLKILLFLAAVLMVIGLIGTVGLTAVNTHVDRDYKYCPVTKKEKKLNNYKESSFFLNDINNYCRSVVSNYKTNADLFNDDVTILTKYSYSNIDSSKDATKVFSTNNEDYNLDKIYAESENTSLRADINSKLLDGGDFDIFYHELDSFYNSKFDSTVFNKLGRSYLYLEKWEYDNILNNLISQDNNEGFKRELEKFDIYVDLLNEDNTKSYYNYDSMRGIIVSPGNVVIIIDINNNYSENNSSFVEGDAVVFDYSYDDFFNRTQKCYIPVELLDSSSYDKLNASIITTPFARNMATIACFSILGSENYRAMNNEYYDNSNLINRTEYKIDESVVATGNEKIDFTSNAVIYYPSEDRFDAKTIKTYKNDRLREIKDAMLSLPDYSEDEVKEAYSNFVSITLEPSFENETVFLMYKYGDICLVMLFAGVVLFLILFVAITVLEKRKSLKTDRWFGEFKLFLLISLITIMLLIGKECVTKLYLFGKNGYIAAFSAFIICAIIVFSSCLACYLGFVRLAKNGEIFNYFIISRLFIFIKNMCREGHLLAKDLSKNLALGSKTLLLIAAYGFINCFIALLAGVISFDNSDGFPIFLAFIILLIFNIAFLLYKWKEKRSYDRISEGIDRILDGELDYKIDTKDMPETVMVLTEKINRIGEGLDNAVAASIKDERMKAELITNVSHDIKTPLTSIINYVDLIKREKITDEPVKGYVDVLDQKSQRLKQLIEDLLEASKASTGNIELNPTTLNLHELISQISAEYEDKFSEKQLNLVANEEEGLTVYADGRRVYRVIDNIFQNAYKYAMPNSRIYLDTKMAGENVSICLKNISEAELNIDADELLERFTRGDSSRNTEGNGLGLSIASNLTKLQNGDFRIDLDGDLFKVTITLPKGR